MEIEGSYLSARVINDMDIHGHSKFPRFLLWGAGQPRGSGTLRKTLFQVMDVLIKTKLQDVPVYG